MFKRKIEHFSLTNEWLKTKSECSNWRIFFEKSGNKHLFRRFSFLLAIHWYSYLNRIFIKERINNTLNSNQKYLFHLNFFKIYNKEYVDQKAAKIEIIKNNFNYKTLIFPSKSSLVSKPENFLVNLNKWDIDSLSKNWRRNLKRSKRSFSGYFYKEIDLLDEIEEVYETILKNSKLKNYVYPYSKIFLESFIKCSSGKVFSIASYSMDTKKLVAVRAFYVVNDTAIDFIAAALPEALSRYITYNIAYELILKAKKLGLKTYNLAGVDYKFNRGVYNFKKGIGGDLVQDGQLFLSLTFKKIIPLFLMKIILKMMCKVI